MFLVITVVLSFPCAAILKFINLPTHIYYKSCDFQCRKLLTFLSVKYTPFSNILYCLFLPCSVLCSVLENKQNINRKEICKLVLLIL